MCVFVAALTAMLAACSNATTASSATEGSDVRYDVEHVQKSLEALEAQRSQKSGATQVDTDATAESVAELLPYIGLPESLIDKTWLGAPDRVGEVIDGGKFKDGMPYYWNAQNGSGDLLFDVIAVDGVVVNVSKYNLAKNYWCDAAGTMRVLLDRTASGARVDGGALTKILPITTLPMSMPMLPRTSLPPTAARTPGRRRLIIGKAAWGRGGRHFLPTGSNSCLPNLISWAQQIPRDWSFHD